MNYKLSPPLPRYLKGAYDKNESILDHPWHVRRSAKS